jgi:REP element-mobilizing transposase RayT
MYFGRIVNYHWEKLPIHFNDINLDKFVIMPNHIHGIIQIVGAMHSPKKNDVKIKNCDGKLVGAMHSPKNDDVKIKNCDGKLVGAMHSPKNDDVKIKNCDGKLVGVMHSPKNDDVKIKNCDGKLVGAMHSPKKNDVKIKNCRRNASPQPPNGTKFIDPTGTTPGSLGAIMQNFQSVTTRKINRIRKTPGFKLWQRNYWEHIIRIG